MFFKRLSRGSRSNSYAENEYNDSPRSLRDGQGPFIDRDIHDSPRGGTPQHNSYPPASPTKDTQRPDSSRGSGAMYATQRSAAPADPYSRATALNGNMNNRGSMQLDGGFTTGPSVGSGPPKSTESAPDLLTRAFNEALRPYTDKIEHLEAQLADLQRWVDTLERERGEMHAWIDKRGLRPGTSLCIPLRPLLFCSTLLRT